MAASSAITEHPIDEEAGPLRRCVVSNRRMPKTELVRFVVGPDNIVVPDVAGRLPGRGIWLSADRNVIKTACARNLFAFAARRQVQVDNALDEQVEQLLRQVATAAGDEHGWASRGGGLWGGAGTEAEEREEPAEESA